jgi:hypothetical protein
LGVEVSGLGWDLLVAEEARLLEIRGRNRAVSSMLSGRLASSITRHTLYHRERKSRIHIILLPNPVLWTMITLRAVLSPI